MITMLMPDGTTWGVPVSEVANSRAEHYKSEFNGDLDRSLVEDTLPLFEQDEYEIVDWASNNMNWSDFKEPRLIRSAEALTLKDFQEAWASSGKHLI